MQALSDQMHGDDDLKYPQSLRNAEDLLFERGIDFCHEPVRL